MLKLDLIKTINKYIPTSLPKNIVTNGYLIDDKIAMDLKKVEF